MFSNRPLKRPNKKGPEGPCCIGLNQWCSGGAVRSRTGLTGFASAIELYKSMACDGATVFATFPGFAPVKQGCNAVPRLYQSMRGGGPSSRGGTTCRCARSCSSRASSRLSLCWRSARCFAVGRLRCTTSRPAGCPITHTTFRHRDTHRQHRHSQEHAASRTTPDQPLGWRSLGRRYSRIPGSSSALHHGSFSISFGVGIVRHCCLSALRLSGAAWRPSHRGLLCAGHAKFCFALAAEAGAQPVGAQHSKQGEDGGAALGAQGVVI